MTLWWPTPWESKRDRLYCTDDSLWHNRYRQWHRRPAQPHPALDAGYGNGFLKGMVLTMQGFFHTIAETLKSGHDAVLCSVLSSSGSTPRGAGAKMAVWEDGNTLGTIGGGPVELTVARQAATIFTGRRSYRKDFCLAPNQVEDLGMICGGSVTVYYQYFDHQAPENIAFLQQVSGLLERDFDAWLITRVEEGSQAIRMGIYDEIQGLRFDDPLTEEELRPHLKRRSVFLEGNPAYYIEPIVQKGRVYIFGGGHVGRALAPVLRDIDFRVTVYDNRPQLAKTGQFSPGINVILGDYREIGAHLTLTERDYVVIMTPGHQADYEVLAQVLRTPATYVGCIGSRHKIAVTRDRLLKAGFTQAALDRIHAPIGLDIGADTPQEIAISVAAELIVHRSAGRERHESR